MLNKCIFAGLGNQGPTTPTNILQCSEDFTSGLWVDESGVTKEGVSSVMDPFGLVRDIMEISFQSVANSGLRYFFATPTDGLYVASVYVRTVSGVGNVRIAPDGANYSPNYQINESWTRILHGPVATSAGFPRIIVQGSVTPNPNVYIFGAQLEPDRLTNYNATTCP